MTKISFKFPLLYLILCISILNLSSCEKKQENKEDSEIKEQALETDKTENDLGNNKATRVSPPAIASMKIGETTVSLEYSQPSVKSREIWGALVPYNKVWRTGANEATTISFDNDVIIEGETLVAGKYALFTIPKKDSDWIIIFNKEASQWGAFDYKEKEDALKIASRPQASKEFNEQLKFTVDPSGTVTLYWEKLMVSFNVK